MNNNTQIKNRDNGRIIGGLIIIGVGAVLLLRNTGVDFPRWIFSWPMILILVGIYTGVKHQFRNPSWMILIGIGTFFLVQRFIPGLSREPLFWPLVLIACGVLFMVRPRQNAFVWNNDKNPDNGGASNTTYLGTQSGAECPMPIQ